MGLLPYSLCICFLLPYFFFLLFFFCTSYSQHNGCCWRKFSPIFFDLRLVSIIFWQKSHFIPLLFPRCLFPRINLLGGGWSFWCCDAAEGKELSAHQTTRQLPTSWELRELDSRAGCIIHARGVREVSTCVKSCKSALFTGCLYTLSQEWGWWFDLHQMFHPCPAVVVTMLIKDLSALMFYSSLRGNNP